ncbi:MAG: XRE family transcriptional regulator [Hydrogenophilales bacterium]|nr:XRE family transcriptional regulator [Hydrogenophilales bacterium]
MEHTVSLCDRLREERNRQGLSQPAWGEIAGVTKKTQMLYEAGDRMPDAAYLAAIAAAGADIQYIVTGIRSAQALSRDEVELLETYRAAPLAVKAAAIGALQSGSASPTQSKQVVHGSVGQLAAGDVVNHEGVKIETGKTEKSGGRRKR